MSNPNDWSNFYINHHQQQNLFPAQPTAASSAVAASTAVTAASSASASSLSPEGRVNKPSRRRTRASRRTPTTLLNTDAANFRAMVQQFTGGPAASAFGSGFSLTAADPGGGGLAMNSPGGAGWQYPYQYMHTRPINNNNNSNSNNNQLPFMFGMSGVMNTTNPNDVTAVSSGFEAADSGGDDGNSGGAVIQSIFGPPRSSGNTSTTNWLQ